LDYDDPVAVNAEIPHSWWLEHDSCKYILSVLVHKDNKDISTRPATLPPGPTRTAMRNSAQQKTEKERAQAKEQLPVVVLQPDGSEVIEKYGDVEHQAKKARADGMRSVTDKNKVDTIMSQISVMLQLEEVCVSRLGREDYERQLIHLANQMPGMLSVQGRSQGALLTTLRSESGGENDDREDDDER
jgi:hypothetical protein